MAATALRTMPGCSVAGERFYRSLAIFKQRFYLYGYLSQKYLNLEDEWTSVLFCILVVHTSIHAEGSIVSHNDRVNEARTMV